MEIKRKKLGKKEKPDLSPYSEDIGYSKFAKKMREKGFHQVEGSRFQPTSKWKRGDDVIEVSSKSKEGREAGIQYANKSPLVTKTTDEEITEVKTISQPGKPPKTVTKKRPKQRKQRPYSPYGVESPFVEKPTDVFANLESAFGGGSSGNVFGMFENQFGGGGFGTMPSFDFIGGGYQAPPKKKRKKRKTKQASSGRSSDQPIVVVIRET